MILTDTGPILALINKNDPNHEKCLEAAKRFPAQPLLTTWPCFTEAMYLLFQAGGYPAQAELWRWRIAHRLFLHELNENDIVRMAALMEKYRDRPMDLADASLIVAAEQIRTGSIFTLDGDFHVYRLSDGSALECLP